MHMDRVFGNAEAQLIGLADNLSRPDTPARRLWISLMGVRPNSPTRVESNSPRCFKSLIKIKAAAT